MKVKVIAIDDQDRVKLSRRAALREAGEGPDRTKQATSGEMIAQADRAVTIGRSRTIAAARLANPGRRGRCSIAGRPASFVHSSCLDALHP